MVAATSVELFASMDEVHVSTAAQPWLKMLVLVIVSRGPGLLVGVAVEVA